MEESMFVLEKEMFLPVQCESALEQSDFLVEDSGLQEAVLAKIEKKLDYSHTKQYKSKEVSTTTA